MATFEDRNREPIKRDDPKDKNKQGLPQREGEGSSDKYSREGQGKTNRPSGEESTPDTPDRDSDSRDDRSSDDMDDRS